MTDSDDPFGRRDRTIIRPNPGGRRVQPFSDAPPPPTPYAPPAPPAWDDWSAPSAAPPNSARPDAPAPNPPYPPPSAPYPAPPGPEAMPYAPPVSAPFAPSTPPPTNVSDELATVSAEPLMRAAASLLLLLGRLRASLSRGAPGQLMAQVAQAIQQFELDARAFGAPREQIDSAKYALAATADDIVQNLPGAEPSQWTQYSMLIRFFQERTGGVKFFQELDRARQTAATNLGLLELMHACLSLGFEGVYRATGGPGALQGVRRDLYETIRRARSKSVEDLSPHWRGQAIALAGSRFQVPVWSVAGAALALLFGVYLFLRGLLSAQAGALEAKIAQLVPSTAIEIFRDKPAPPPPPPPKPPASTQLQRISAALAEEIVSGKAAAIQTAQRIVIRVGNVVLFPPGGASANPSFAPIAQKIAHALDPEAGPIFVEGYTDSDPIKSLPFPSNVELSEARAKSVASMLKGALAKPERLQVIGKGEANPVAPNDVEANKAKNRRVEISIARAD